MNRLQNERIASFAENQTELHGLSRRDQQRRRSHGVTNQIEKKAVHCYLTGYTLQFSFTVSYHQRSGTVWEIVSPVPVKTCSVRFL